MRLNERSVILSALTWVLSVVAAVPAALALQATLGGCGVRTVDKDLVAMPTVGKNILVGRTVELDGSKSRDARNRQLTFSWSIVEKPEYSKAVLVGPADVKPRFTPDQPGKYTFQLKVSSGVSEGEPATATATADYAPADFLRVDTRVITGDPSVITNYSIKVGPMLPDGTANQVSYPAPTFSGSAYGVHVLVMNRIDGSIVSHKSYPINNLTQLNTLAADLSGLGTDKSKLVIVSSLWYPVAPPSYPALLCGNKTDPASCPAEAAFENLGSSGKFMYQGGLYPSQIIGYTLIGINGIGKGNGFERSTGDVTYPIPSTYVGDSVGSISGKLVRDSFQKYWFTYDYVPFETRTTSDNTSVPVNSIQIGSTNYPLPSALPDANSGGFHVLVLSRGSLNPYLHNLYLVNKSGVAQSDQIKTMGSDLAKYKIRGMYEDYLVIISSVGVLPTIRSFGSNGVAAEQAIEVLGGTPGVFPSLTSADSYALVGIPAITTSYGNYWRFPNSGDPIVAAEASTILTPGTSADIRGLLRGDHLGDMGLYIPYLYDSGGSEANIDYSLLTTALQDPTAWRGPDTDAEKQVYADISKALIGSLSLNHSDDMRLYYYMTSFSWEDRYAILQNMTCESLYNISLPKRCDDATSQAFTTMKGYLITEIGYRNDLQTWFYQDITQLLNGLQGTDAIDLVTAYTNALELAKVENTHEAGMKALEVTESVLEVAARIAELAVKTAVVNGESSESKLGPALGLASSLIALGLDFIPSPTNNGPGEVKEAAKDLLTDLIKTYLDTTANLNQAFLYITEDWGRMQAMHSAYTGIYDYTMYQSVLERMEPGFLQYFYKILLPITFKAEGMVMTTPDLEYCDQAKVCDYYACKSGGKINYYVADDHCLFSSSKGSYRPDDASAAIQNLAVASSPCSTSHHAWSFYTVWKGGGKSSGDYYDDTNIKLFPSTDAGGLGVPKLQFATRWPFTYSYQDNWNDGCNCSPNTHYCP
jgi:hypothetical protein